MVLLSLTATCQVWTESLKAGLFTYNWPAADCLQPTLRCGFRQQLTPGVRPQPSGQAHTLSLESNRSLLVSVLTLYISFG
jgi:hypothetical protein